MGSKMQVFANEYMEKNNYSKFYWQNTCVPWRSRAKNVRKKQRKEEEKKLIDTQCAGNINTASKEFVLSENTTR